MNSTAIHTAMLTTVINAKPSALVTINAAGGIYDVYITGHSRTSLIRFLGHDFLKTLGLIFADDNQQLLINAYHTCLNAQQQITIAQIEHISQRSLVEYFSCTFSPAPEQSVIAYFENITDSVLIKEEFCSITTQHEALNQDLCVAMANLDFQLMDLDHAHKKLSALYRITAIVQKTVNETEVINEILDGITRELGFVNAAIFLLDTETKMLINKVQRGYNGDVRIPLGEGITGYAALHRELVHVPNINLDPRYISGTSNAFSEVAIPLIVNEQVIGVLDVETAADHSLQAYDLDLLRSLASQIAMTIAHASHVTQAYKEAATDGLTLLYNYRHFRNIISQELKRAIRYSRPLSLLLIDIDYFKNYNDVNGHLYGDSALKLVAELIQQHCRDTDAAFRYGGEEFAVLLPETITAQAYIIAERIRQAIAEYSFANACSQPGGAMTVSIGIASYPENAKSELELIAAADTALYFAKRSTRNRCCLYSQIK